MELLVNDLSIQSQFPDITTFQAAIDRLISMRNLSHRFGVTLYCHRNMALAQVTKELNMPQAIRYFSKEKQSALMAWITKNGPYWEDYQEHNSDDYLECNEQIVTDCAIGEAAFRCFHSGNCQLISMTPSNWEHSPLSVWWRRGSHADVDTQVINHCNTVNLETTLRLKQPSIESWQQLGSTCCERFINLKFSEDAFKSLDGHPFVPGAAKRIVERLEILDQYKVCFDVNGQQTQKGNQIYQEHFTGDKSWFSDSSDDEKRDFKDELTFKHPAKDGKTLFCTMHGKVNTPKIRIHFSWPITANSALYVVYVGHKITKR